MMTVEELNLNEDQKQLVTGIINQFGTGNHPYCTNNNLDLFTRKYLEEILVNKYDEIKKNLTEEGKDVFDSILNLFKDNV